MIQTMKSAWKIPELRKRILFTIGMIMIYRLGSFISVPYVNTDAISSILEGNSMFGLLNVISGNNFKQFSIFAMSITPYINASIIIQLLTIVFPSLERLQHQGEEGRKKLGQYTRYTTIILALIQAFGISMGFSSLLVPKNAFTIALACLVITAGTSFLMWIGETITEKGIGNGISILIFSGIVASLPDAAVSMFDAIKAGDISIITFILFLVFAVAVIVGVVAMTQGTRKIPVQYAKRVVGRKMYGGQNTHIPLKLNQSGVMPIIFASTITTFPATLAAFFPNSAVANWFGKAFAWGGVVSTILYVVLIIFFTYFYTLITFNPEDVANNLRQYGGFIPGIRPGGPTIKYLKNSLNKLMVAGSIFLAAIAILPIIIGNIMDLNLQFGGTSLLIIVGVALETVNQLEQQMLMRNYKGFLKK